MIVPEPVQEVVTQKEVLDASFYVISSIIGFIVTCLFVIGGWFIGMILSRLGKAEADISHNREYFKDEVADLKSDLRSNTESDVRIHKDMESLSTSVTTLNETVSALKGSVDTLIEIQRGGK